MNADYQLVSAPSRRCTVRRLDELERLATG